MIGVEWSLGSGPNHSLSGIAWFGGIIVWYIVAVLLRPSGLLIIDNFTTESQTDTNIRHVFI